MLMIVPDEVLDLLNHWEDDCCPKCGGSVIFDNLYCGGRGYKTYRVCNSGECDWMRRA